MRHLCICSFEYGANQGPEGICTQRLADALYREGVKVTVITSEGAETSAGRQGGQSIIRVTSRPFRPAFFWRWAEQVLSNWRFFGRNYHLFWQARVRLLAVPDDVTLIYGRSMPLSGCLAAWRLARRNGLPLLIHFSDPVLSPWFSHASMPRRLLRRYYLKLTSAAVGISFATPAAIAYSERTMGVDLGAKAFVLPHVAPAAMRFGRRDGNSRPVFLYAGRFYGARGPEKLLAGFANFLERCPGATFRFVGAEAGPIEQEAARLGISRRIEILPFTRDVAKAFGDAHVLVATDAFEGEPVFLSTKIIEYLLTDRPVLLLSPRNSPASKLVSQFPETAVFTDLRADSISSSMEFLVARKYESADFERRFSAMDEFSAAQVAQRLIAVAEGKLARQKVS